MTINAAEKKSVIGLKDLYIAEVTQDDADAYAAGTPAIFAPAVTASHKPVTSTKTQYADDGAFDVLNSEGETTITLEVTNIPLVTLAAVLGKEYDAATGRLFDNTGAAPYFALSFRARKSNGSYKYYQYLKGNFAIPEEEQATLADAPDPKTIKITYTAIKTTYEFDLGSVNEGVKRVVGDDDADNFDETGWFTSVQVPVAGSPSAITCTPSPIDGATDQLATVVITLTFNNPLESGEENGAALLRDDTGAAIVVTRSMNAARTVLTLGHASLTAATKYYIVVSHVTDIYGQTLADVVYDFTVAA